MKRLLLNFVLSHVTSRADTVLYLIFRFHMIGGPKPTEIAVQMAARHERVDFLLQGLEVLVADGHRSLTAARMSRELGVTSGSFYWHFKTIDDFRSELKKFWRDEIVIGIIREAGARAEAPAGVLEEIGRIVSERKADRFDSAMRVWAQLDREARKVVESADRLRRKLINEVLKSNGAAGDEAEDRVNLLGAAWQGSRDLKDTDYRLKLIGMITQNADD